MESKRIAYLSTISLNEQIKYIKLLFRWEGSVWKLLWVDLFWFIFLYICVTLLYRLYLINDPFHKQNFETIIKYMNKVAGLVPLSFLLGFFVSTILGRWWAVVHAIPWMTSPTFAVQTLIRGPDRKKVHNARLAFVRYLNLAWILSVMSLSGKIKEKFRVQPPRSKFSRKSKPHEPCSKKPTTVSQRMDKINEYHVVSKYFGKLVNSEETEVFDKFETAFLSTQAQEIKVNCHMPRKSYKPNYTIALMWATRLLERCREEGLIVSEFAYMKLYEIVANFRGSLGALSLYTEFNIPLVYTQVVIIVVYTFLLSEIFSQQVITQDYFAGTTKLNSTFYQKITTNIEAYFPIFTLFKFLIYMGWFKIGLSLVNPFGNEKSDLPLDDIMDYNLEISARIAPSSNEYYPSYLEENPNMTNTERFEWLDRLHKDFHDDYIQETKIDSNDDNYPIVTAKGDSPSRKKLEIA